MNNGSYFSMRICSGAIFEVKGIGAKASSYIDICLLGKGLSIIHAFDASL